VARGVWRRPHAGVQRRAPRDRPAAAPRLVRAGARSGDHPGVRGSRRGGGRRRGGHPLPVGLPGGSGPWPRRRVPGPAGRHGRGGRPTRGRLTSHPRRISGGQLRAAPRRRAPRPQGRARKRRPAQPPVVRVRSGPRARLRASSRRSVRALPTAPDRPDPVLLLTARGRDVHSVRATDSLRGGRGAGGAVLLRLRGSGTLHPVDLERARGGSRAGRARGRLQPSIRAWIDPRLVRRADQAPRTRP